MRSWSIGIAVIAVAFAACGGESVESDAVVDGSTSEASTRSTGSSVPSTPSNSQVAGSGADELAGGDGLVDADEHADRRWAEFTATIDTAGMETQAVAPGGPEIMVVESTSAGYIAAGLFGAGLAVWGADDFGDFTPLYNEVCCDRVIYPTAIAEFDGTILLGGWGEVGEARRRRSFLLRSDDGGSTWASIEHPIFAEQTNRLDDIMVIGDSVIVDVLHDASGSRPDSVAVRSTDLRTWTRLELPGRVDTDWPWYRSDGTTLFAISTRYEGSEGTRSEQAVWSSDDGGRSFATRPPLTRLDGGVAAVDGSLVQFPTSYQSETQHAEPEGIRVLAPGGSWVEDEPDVGQWGDGDVGFGLTDRMPGTGRFYGLATRAIRASAHYCYVDVSTCQQHEGVLLSSDDGVEWRDVGGLDVAAFFGLGGGSGIDVAADGTIVVWQHHGRSTRISGSRWSSPEPPPLIDPPEYAPPPIPVELYDHDRPFPVGSIARYPLGLGGCGGLYVDDRLWEPETPIVEPVPDAWPYRAVTIADGPTGYVYGRIERIAADEISFSIDDIGEVATFRPAPPPAHQCGG